MKKLVCFLMIIGMIVLNGCSYFVSDGSENPVVNDEKTGTADSVDKDDEVEAIEPDEPNKPDETVVPEEPEESESPDVPDEPNEPVEPEVPDTPAEPEEPEKTEESLNDYVTSLIGSTYCSDADFLNFAVNLDKRVAKRTLYVANNGDGEGSYDDPMSIYDAMDNAKAGDTIYLRGGEYIFEEAIWLDVKGTKDNYIVIKSYPGERAVLTTTPENVSKYSENGEYIFFGIESGCSYIVFENLEIKGATSKAVAAFACYDGGQNHLIFKNNIIHDLNTTTTKGECNAFLFMGEKRNSINNILLIGNSCYDLTLGYSEAVSFAGNCEYCYVIGNMVYDNTNIGIDFYGNAGYCSTESLDQARYCVAAYNEVYNCNSPYADCAGIYVDGGRNCLIEKNHVWGCQYGIEIGSEEKNDRYPVTDIIVRSNVLEGNSVCAVRVGGYDKKSSGTVMNCLFAFNSFIDNLGDYDIIISKVDGIKFESNLFSGSRGYVETEFDTSYIKNISFFDNCFVGRESFVELFNKELSMDELNGSYGSGNRWDKNENI